MKESITQVLGKLKYFIGMKITYSRWGIFLSQLKYTSNLHRETKTSGEKSTIIVIYYNEISRQNEDNPPIDKGRYQRLIDKLIYLPTLYDI